MIAPRTADDPGAGILTGAGVLHFCLALLGPGLALPPAVRARVALLRDRARDALVVTCGGVSMEPAIRRGDRIAIEARPPRVGDVAAFVTPRGELELHRLIARAPLVAWWVHGGDNQTAPALGLVHAQQIVGVAGGHARAPRWRDRVAATRRIAAAAWHVTARARDRSRGASRPPPAGS